MEGEDISGLLANFRSECVDPGSETVQGTWHWWCGHQARLESMDEKGQLGFPCSA